MARQDTISAVEDFAGEDLDFRPVEGLAGFGEIARHILDASHALTGMMLDGVENMSGPRFRELIEKYKPSGPEKGDAAGLAAGLRKSFEEQGAALAARKADFWSGMVTRFDGQEVTRLELLQFAKEHELAHRQQLFMYLRLKGIVPATTRRRQGKQKA
jgi:uncharacterized damage-inducible protein DinB